VSGDAALRKFPLQTGDGSDSHGRASNYASRINLRLGAFFTPRFGFAGGLDVPLPSVRVGPDFVGRLDAETFVRTFSSQRGLFSTSGTEAYVCITLNQVYVRGLRSGGHLYAGFGLGAVVGVDPFLNQPGVAMGKVFGGVAINSRVSTELSAHIFTTDTRLSLQLRLGF
jgi:hypothetical protein